MYTFFLQGGGYLLDLLDYYAAGWPYLFIGFTELIIISHVYGIQNFLDDVFTIVGIKKSDKFIKLQVWGKSVLFFIYTTLAPLIIFVILIISSSSSGLLPTKIYSKCKNSERCLIGHPFNPVYLLPAVEIVPGKKTGKNFMNRANKFYKSIAMNPIMLKKELPGYLSDRLQEALWREALHIVNDGYATTKDLDRSIEDGPGLRWSLMGVFLTFHLAGGKAGMKHMLEQFGPALKLPWTKLKAPKLSKKLSSRVIAGTNQQARGRSVAMISNIRDEYLVNLQKLRKKYENKIRK